MLKILKIIGFEFRIVFSPGNSKKKSAPLLEALKMGELTFEEKDLAGEAQIGLQAADRLGRWWNVSTLQVTSVPGEKKWGVKHSVFTKLERVVALLLEKEKGRLPFWLLPEQVRLLVVGVEVQKYAAEIESELKKRDVRLGLQVIEKEKLSQAVHQGLKKGVAELLVVGEREEKTETLTVRTQEGKEPENMPVHNYLERIEKQVRRFESK